MTLPAQLPAPPYYAVIFPNQRSGADEAGYAAMAERMAELAPQQPGYLGVDSVRGADGFGITVSYWASEQHIAAWKANAVHRVAQETGRAQWYADYHVMVAKVERSYRFSANANANTNIAHQAKEGAR